MSDVKWIKIVTDIFDDEKIKYIETLPNGDETIVIWFRLLCLCGKSNNNGLLMMTDKIAYTEDMLSSIFNRELKSVQLALSVFESLEMIERIDNKIYLLNWEKHQNAEKMNLIKEQTRQRVANYRAKRIESNANTVTQPLQDSYSNAIDIDKELDIKNKNKELKNKDILKNKTYVDFDKIEVEVLDEKEVWFNLFWKEYPKKSAKKNAKSQFVKIVKSKETLDTILQDIRNRMNTQEWIKNNGQFIPFPSTYLNQERWTDEVVVMKGMSFLDIE